MTQLSQCLAKMKGTDLSRLISMELIPSYHNNNKSEAMISTQVLRDQILDNHKIRVLML